MKKENNMAQYTTLTKEEIDKIAATFSIETIDSFHVLSGGSENTNYALFTKKGNYVLTICEQKTEQKALELALLLEHLEQHNFNSSKVLRNNKNKLIDFYKGKPYMMKVFLEGSVHESLPVHLMELMGVELGKLHKIEAPDFVTHQTNFGKEQFSFVKNYAPNSDFEKWLNEKHEELKPYFLLDLPRVLIHSDLFANNTVISEDETTLTIMDFEEAVYYYRIFDVGMTIIGSCRKDNTIDKEKVSAFLKGYTKEIKLTKLEVDSLKAFTIYAGTAMTYWRHLNFNYTEPTPALFDHYLGLKVITEFVKNLPNEYFHGIVSQLIPIKN